MKQSHAGCLAVALLLTSAVLAGCIGSEAGGESPVPDAGDNASTPDADRPRDDAGNATDDASEAKQSTDGNGTTDGDDGSTEARIPADAMSAEPADTQPGMAHFAFEDEASVAVFGEGGESRTWDLHDPGDVTFFDVHVHSEAAAASWDVDLDLYLYNGTGEQVASSAVTGTNEYVFWTPDDDVAQNFTIEVASYLSKGDAYTVDVWVWTVDDWNASHPWTDVWERSYDWGQTEACIQEPACVSVVGGINGDPVGVTGDGTYDFGGYIWNACSDSGNVNTEPNATAFGGPRSLPCPDTPYTSVSVVIDDDLAGQQVGAIWTTCSVDNDTWCGETDNVNDSKADGNPGPNELTATFCGVVQGLTRDANTAKDGTGSGIWDQRDERYETGNGTMADHPGVGSMSVFLVGPQRGGGGICPNANPYTGPTTGTITIIAQKAR